MKVYTRVYTFFLELASSVHQTDAKKETLKLFFTIAFGMRAKRRKIPISRFKRHFVLGDLRKFCEQYGDAIGWDQSNRAYIMTHGVSGVD